MTRRDDIATLVAEWKDILSELGLSEPSMNHHKLLMLLAEEILDGRLVEEVLDRKGEDDTG